VRDAEKEKNIRIKSIGFISTRFAGTDGVFLETGKWAEDREEGQRDQDRIL
jgi:hypothetical protein